MSDELARALRELARQHRAAPTVGPAGIRARAQRRGHRRRAALVLGGTTLAACALTVAAALTPTAGDTGALPRTPAGAPSAAPHGTPTPVPLSSPGSAGLLDMDHRTLTAGGRVMRVSRQSATALAAGRELTVTAKYDVLPRSASAARTDGPDARIPYVVELRAADGSRLYVGALPANARTAPDWVGLTGADARWYYSGAREGDQVRVVTSVTTTSGPARTAPPGGG
ncbi:hypothetical protein [Streptomyces sp. NPDC007929]|uniref:hypothetical protein n=1 Tax=unclassified Streptomyces TaxID=2593676 RepID=UPI0036E8CCC6